MGKWNIKKIYKKIPLHPSFILLFFWFVLTNNFFSFLLFVLVILTHEFGHYIVALKCGYKLDYFYIAPYGVSLNYKEKIFDSRDEILIALAGPLVNFFLCVLVVTFWWIYPSIYGLTVDFVYQSLMLGLFNMLPCYPLDGGRIFCGILSKQMERQKAIKVVRNLNLVFSALLFICFVYSCFYNFNPTFLLASVFLLFGNLDIKNESNYQPLFLFDKKVKNFSRPIFLYVKGEVTITKLLKHIQANKYTIFIVQLKNEQVKIMDEQKLKKLAINLSPALSLNEIFIRDKV